MLYLSDVSFIPGVHVTCTQNHNTRNCTCADFDAFKCKGEHLFCLDALTVDFLVLLNVKNHTHTHTHTHLSAYAHVHRPCGIGHLCVLVTCRYIMFDFVTIWSGT